MRFALHCLLVLGLVNSSIGYSNFADIIAAKLKEQPIHTIHHTPDSVALQMELSAEKSLTMAYEYKFEQICVYPKVCTLDSGVVKNCEVQEQCERRIKTCSERK